ncbi:MAG: protein kinase, partial [Planctomycetes bacterium]|nr:protein kinase [Planctomycetota bacterium]
MTPERWRRVREIFERALDLDAAERDRFVAEACAGDDDLDRRVRRLLESDASATDALEPPSIPEVNVAEGARLGGFRIRRVLGSGGMGTVYEAEQDHPHRAVALKVLRLGLRSDSALRRFRFESEVLARLVHPGIAHVYGAGTERDPGGLDVPW